MAVVTLSGLKEPTALPSVEYVLINLVRDTFIGKVRKIKCGVYYQMEITGRKQRLTTVAEVMVATTNQSHFQQINHLSYIATAEGVSKLEECAILNTLSNGTKKLNVEVAILMPHVESVKCYIIATTTESLSRTYRNSNTASNIHQDLVYTVGLCHG